MWKSGKQEETPNSAFFLISSSTFNSDHSPNMNRRHFLHSAAAASALAATPFNIRAQDKAGAKKFRVALIGCGWWGNNILREAVASGSCELVALCDVGSRQFELTMKNGGADSGATPKL